MRYTQFLSCDTPQSEKAYLWNMLLFFLILGDPENFNVYRYRRFVVKPLLVFYVFLHVCGNKVVLLNKIAFAFWRGVSHIGKKI